MSHTISGVAGSLLSQMLMGPRANNTSSKKPTKAFQTIDSDGEIAVNQQHVKQAVVSMSASDGLPSSDTTSNMERIDLQGLTQNSTDKNTSNTNSATGSSGIPTPVGRAGSLKSLVQLDTQVAASGNPGSVVNVLI